MRTVLIALLLALVAFAGPSSAQSFIQTHIYLNPTPAASDFFGHSVAGVGNRAFVGAPEDDAGATDAGAAYIFDTTTGALLVTILNPDPMEGDWFGFTVAAVGNNVLIGAPLKDVGTSEDAGAAYLFDGTTGLLLQSFASPSPDPGDQFGIALAGLGNDVLIGAPFDDTAANDAGAAYLLNAITGAPIRTFSHPAPAASDEFGTAIAGAGSNVLVGAPRRNAGAISDAGAAYLFNGNTGGVIFTLLNPTPANLDRFGNAVAAAGNDLIVAARLDNTTAGSDVIDAGAAYLFSGTTGTLIRTFTNPAPAGGDQFGSAVASVGSNVMILVGAPLNDASNAGSAYLFDGTTGAVIQTFDNPSPGTDDRFGFSVAGIGNKVLIGTPFDNIGGNDTGTAYLYAAASANASPIANAGADQTLECTSPAGTPVTLDGSGSSDPDNDQLMYTWRDNGNVIVDPTDDATSLVTLDFGSHTIELTVDDGNGETDTDVVLITIEDTTPPIITLNPAIMLWPPNHKYVTISISQCVAEVSDACAGGIPLSAVKIASVSSDEPEDAPDGQCTITDPLHICFNGDGSTTSDMVIAADCQSVNLRSERAASNNGRVYTLNLEVSDASGNVATAAFEVSVPHDQGGGSVVVDNGPYHTVAGSCGSSSAPKVAAGNGEDRAAGATASGFPNGYALLQNYPNPFNPDTEIRFRLLEASRVVVKIFNNLGEEIRTLADGDFAAGFHALRWNGRNHRGEKVQSGMYFCRLATSKFSDTRKMILAK